MPSKNAAILKKMLKYCDDSVKYSAGCEYDEFIQNELYLTFSVFSLSQLGELSIQLEKELITNHPDIPWQALRGLRNRIVHNYDGVKHTILWDVLTKDIPLLKQQLLSVYEKVQYEMAISAELTEAAVEAASTAKRFTHAEVMEGLRSKLNDGTDEKAKTL